MAPVIVFMKTRRPQQTFERIVGLLVVEWVMCPGWEQQALSAVAAWPVMTIMQWFNDVGVSSGTSTSDILQDIEDDIIQ